MIFPRVLTQTILTEIKFRSKAIMVMVFAIVRDVFHFMSCFVPTFSQFIKFASLKQANPLFDNDHEY